MTPLRKRMIEDLQLQGLSPRTEQAYVAAVAALARYYGRSPAELTEEDIRGYFVHLIEERKLSASTINQQRSALKFFYETTLGREWSVFGKIKQRRGRRLPIVMSHAEVRRLLGAVRVERHRVGMVLGYVCGLRISEALGLRVPDIDGDRHLVRVAQGKGRKDRYVPITERTLGCLREYCAESRPPDLLFPSRYVPSRPAHPKALQIAVRLAAGAAGITKHVTFHTLRHCFATHLLERGVDLRTIQMLMGHRSAETTAIYTHVTDKTLDRLSRALEELSEDL